jgi:glycosyltransferase involved in cell wall biosynthesis
MILALFFTNNISLKQWVDTGLFDREKQLYEEHLHRRYLRKVYWLTYGKKDAELAKQLKSSNRLHPDIEVLPIPHSFFAKSGCLLYSFLIPLLHHRSLKEADVLKTNQMDGSRIAVIAKWLYHKPLVVRTGYTASLFAQRQSRTRLKKNYERMEQFAYRHADIGVVASCQDKQYICSKYRISQEKVEVLYNYVDTTIFRPTNCEKYTDRIIFIGRLNLQKNLFNLIEAISSSNLTLDIYGKGELRDKLEAWAKRLNAKVNFMGIVPNRELPQVLNRYRYYILPSLYEGMPKSLLEAMACGLICTGTNVEGINEIIEDGVNGYLAKGTQTQALVEVINKATQPSHNSVTQEGIRKIHNNFSLKAAVEQEKEIFMKMFQVPKRQKVGINWNQ